jgi:hypothetical protein
LDDARVRAAAVWCVRVTTHGTTQFSTGSGGSTQTKVTIASSSSPSKVSMYRRTASMFVELLLHGALVSVMLVWAYVAGVGTRWQPAAVVGGGVGGVVVVVVEFGAYVAGVAAYARVVRVGSGRLGAWIARTLPSPPFLHPLADVATASKWHCQWWKLEVHWALAVYGAFVVLVADATESEPIAGDAAASFERPVSPAMRRLYFAQVAAWLYTSVSHVCWEARRRDYHVMYAHHVTTLALLIGSWALNATRLGAAVVLLHDVSDLPVSAMQLVNAVKLQGRRGWYASETCFALGYVTWIGTRLYLFPVHVIAHASAVTRTRRVRSVGTAIFVGSTFADADMAAHTVWMQRLVLLLQALACMHVWWFGMLSRIAYKVATKGAHAAGQDEYATSSSLSSAVSASASADRDTVAVTTAAAAATRGKSKSNSKSKSK